MVVTKVDRMDVMMVVRKAVVMVAPKVEMLVETTVSWKKETWLVEYLAEMMGNMMAGWTVTMMVVVKVDSLEYYLAETKGV